MIWILTFFFLLHFTFDFCDCVCVCAREWVVSFFFYRFLFIKTERRSWRLIKIYISVDLIRWCSPTKFGGSLALCASHTSDAAEIVCAWHLSPIRFLFSLSSVVVVDVVVVVQYIYSINFAENCVYFVRIYSSNDGRNFCWYFILQDTETEPKKK